MKLILLIYLSKHQQQTINANISVMQLHDDFIISLLQIIIDLQQELFLQFGYIVANSAKDYLLTGMAISMGLGLIDISEFACLMSFKSSMMPVCRPKRVQQSGTMHWLSSKRNHQQHNDFFMSIGDGHPKS